MAQNSPRVMIVEPLSDLASLYRAVIEDDGLSVVTVATAESPVAAVAEHRPDAIVLSLPAGADERALTSLDALRSDDATRSIPVVVLSTSERLAELSKVARNVSGSLVLPFDIDDLSRELRGALGRPPAQAASLPPADTPRDAAVNILRRHAQRAIFRWVQRIEQESPWRERQDLGLGALIDHAPAVFELLLERLQADQSSAPTESPATAGVSAVREHAETRRVQGFALDELLHEYALMRLETGELLHRFLDDSMGASDLRLLHIDVDATFDAVIEESVRHYLGSAVRMDRPPN